MEILLCFLVFLKLYFWFLAEDGRENDMYYMVTALSEFTKKIVVLAFKNMLTSWVSEDYNKRMLAVIPQMKYDLNYLQNYFSLQILKALMNTVAMRKYQPKISKAFWKLFFYTWIVLNVHMQYHVHIVTFLHVCDQNLLIHVHVPVYIALCFVIKVLIFNILLNVLSWTYVWKTSRPRFIP